MKTNQHANLIKDVMHSPVVSVGVGNTIRKVESILTLHNMNTLLVLGKGEPVGLITKKIVETAIHYNLEDDLVEDFMIRSFSVTKSDELVSSVTPIIIEEKQELIPVVDRANKLVGEVISEDIFRVITTNDPKKKFDF